MSIIIDTNNLKEKLQKAEQTGLIAWEIGKIAKNIKENESYTSMKGKEYSVFGEYTTKELQKEEATINMYIKIYDTFPNVEDIENSLVTHLKELIRIHDKDTREFAVKLFEETYSSLLHEINEDPKKKLFTAKEISSVVNLIKSSGKLTEEEIKAIITEQIRLKEEKVGKKSNKFGQSLGITYCKKLNETIENEPIDEQGVVAIFCLAFECIKELEFDFGNGKVKFQKIKFVRVAFPDACIFTINNKGVRREVCVEFEFNTYNYFAHKHHMTKEKCDLIVAWEDNINAEKYPLDQIQKLPPIFLLKNFLYNGDTFIIKKKKIQN